MRAGLRALLLWNGHFVWDARQGYPTTGAASNTPELQSVIPGIPPTDYLVYSQDAHSRRGTSCTSFSLFFIGIFLQVMTTLREGKKTAYSDKRFKVADLFCLCSSDSLCIVCHAFNNKRDPNSASAFRPARVTLGS